MSENKRGARKGRKTLAAAVAIVVVCAVAGGVVWYVAPERTEHVEAVAPAPQEPAAPRSAVPATRVGIPAALPGGASTHKTISGVVHGTNGKPASGVTVALSTAEQSATLLPTGQLNGTNTVSTDDNGRFEFNTLQTPQAVVARGEGGCAIANLLETGTSPELLLLPWGRVEGVARRGRTPVARTTIQIACSVQIPGRDGEFLQKNISASTDAEGKFVLDHVPPGALRLGLPASSSRGGTRLEEVVVRGGATSSVALGGKGRPVVGKLVPPLSADSRQVTLIAAARDPFEARDFSTLSDPDRIVARHEMMRSAEYQQWQAARRNALRADVEGDGSFRIDEVSEGHYTLQATFLAKEQRAAGAAPASEQIATARAQVSVEAIPGGASDQPLDIGTIPLTVVRRLMAGQPVPPFEALDPQGKPVGPAQFKGRYLLLVISPTTGGGIERNAALRFGGVFDRYYRDPRVAVLVVHSGEAAEVIARESAKTGVCWLTAFTTDPNAIPGEYTSAQRALLLFDPNGNLVIKSTDPFTAYAQIDQALGVGRPFTQSPLPDVLVQAERAVNSVAAGGADYEQVPAPSGDDAATAAQFTSVAGVPVRPSDSADRLRDGHIQTSPDDPQNSFFYEVGTVEGRLRIDLTRPVEVQRVNTYSWHKDGRAAQVYVLYGSLGNDPAFEPAPGLGVDPAKRGWTRLAVVDTRNLGPGGRHSVSVSRTDAATLGKFRYLLLEMFPTETRDRFGHTFYGEIDVIEKK